MGLFNQFSSTKVKFLICKKFLFANFVFWFFKGRQMSVTKACNLISSSVIFDATTNSAMSIFYHSCFHQTFSITIFFLALISGFKSAFTLGLTAKKYRNFTWFPGSPQNFHSRKSGEIAVFLAVAHITKLSTAIK